MAKKGSSPKTMNPSDVESEEIRVFRRNQGRLKSIWQAVTGPEPTPHTSVVIPSLSLDQGELAKIDGVSFYEERNLFALMRLRHPRCRVIYVTSQPVDPAIVEHYLQLLVGVPASHARRRLTMLSTQDASPRPLSEKLLERPRMIERIRGLLGDPESAYLTCFNSTASERSLAVALGIPLNGVDPDLTWLGTKSGSRRVFGEAGVPYPLGVEGLTTMNDVVEALVMLSMERPGLRRALLKLNSSFAGEGNGVFCYPPNLVGSSAERRPRVSGALRKLELPMAGQQYEEYVEQFCRMGGVVEELVEGAEVCSPSVQMRILPNGDLRLVSTHDQVLGGRNRQCFEGCTFPASEEYRQLISVYAASVGEVLRRYGVVSRFGTDFLVRRTPTGWEALALEINLRMGGTTHPFMALQFLTSGELDPESGNFMTARGTPKFYYATDNLRSPAYRGLLPEDLIDLATLGGIHYDPSTETGVLFHLIGALSQFGKLGATCIADSPRAAIELHHAALEILERECRPQPGQPFRQLFDPGIHQLE